MKLKYLYKKELREKTKKIKSLKQLKLNKIKIVEKIKNIFEKFSVCSPIYEIKGFHDFSISKFIVQNSKIYIVIQFLEFFYILIINYLEINY